MHTNHLASRHLSNLGAFTLAPTQGQLDSAAAAKLAIEHATLDSAGAYAANGIRDDAVSMVVEWAATPATDLDDGETFADRLLAMAVGLADENMDGDIGEDEADVIEVGLNAMGDFMATQGVSDADIVAVLDEGDAEAANRVHELLSQATIDDAVLDAFIFDSESAEAVLDDVHGILDATYKKRLVIRKGKKVRINKRVSGKVRLSAAQKVAIRKASLKARSSKARVRRMRSMKLRDRAGLK